MNSFNSLSPVISGTIRVCRTIVIGTAVALTLAGVASAQNSVGLHFVRGPAANEVNVQNGLANSLATTDVAGAPGYTQGNWNNLGFRGTNVAVVNSAGAASGVTVDWVSGNAWSVGGGGTPANQGTPDGNLMNSYLDSNGNGNAALTANFFANSANSMPLVFISGISTWMAAEGVTSYDLVLYADNDNAGGRVGEYWAQSATGPTTAMTYGSDLSSHIWIRDYNNFNGNPTYVLVPPTSVNGRVADAGNYTVFTGLSAGSILVRGTEFNTRCNINNLQLIPRTTPIGAVVAPLPASATYSGGNASFRAVVSGAMPFTYRWLKNGAPLSDGGNISGSTTATLVVSNVSGGDIAPYSLVVTNPIAVVTSSAAPLSIITPVSGSYAEKIVTNLPAAYWRLNETGDPSTNNTGVIDSFGGFNGVYGTIAQNGFNGIAGPAPTDYPGFEANNTGLRSANGVNPVGNLPFFSWAVAAPMNLNTNTVTVCAWIYPTANQLANTAILSARGGDVFGFGWGNNGNNNIGYTWNNGQFNYLSGLIPLTNAWSFIALVVSPTNAILYCYNTNGQFSATNTVAHSNEVFSAATMIGDDPSSTGTPQNRAFTGVLDEVAVFGRSLPASEILDMYKRGLAVTGIKPVIPVQPTSLALFAGRTATFSIVASGDTPLSYQWRRNGVNLSNSGNTVGALSPSLTISNVGVVADTAGYDVVVNNGAGSLTSIVANLTVVISNAVPVPYEAKLRAGNPAAYWRMNEANGSPYCYDYWGGNIVTNINASLGVPGPRTPDYSGMETTNSGAQYDGLSASTESTASLLNNLAQFSVVGWFNTAGTIGQRVGLFGQNDVVEFGFHGLGPDGQALLGVFTPRGSAFLGQSTNIIPGVWYLIAAVASGTNVNLYLASTNGAGGIRVVQSTVNHAATANYGSSLFPFRIGGGGVLDATGNFFTGVIDDVAIYNRAITVSELSDLFGAALSGGDLPPNIAVQPSSQTLYAGRTASFSVSALGTSPSFRWRTNGVPVVDSGNLSGAATPIITITNIGSSNTLTYDVVITNRVGSVTSSPVTLTVISPLPGSYEAAVIAANPIAYYRLSETNDPSLSGLIANDYWGGRNGTYAIATLNGFNGILGPVPPIFAFETNNTGISVSTIPDSWVTAPFGSLSTNTVTMTMWIQPTGPFDQFAGLLINRNAGVAGGFGYTGGNLGYTWNNNNAATYNGTYGHASGRSDLIPPLNEWSFVALVVEPTQATVYMMNPHGILSATNVLAHTADVFGNNWQIGRDNNANANDGSRNFVGLIDEVGVFNYALTGTQLRNLYLSAGPAPVTLTIVPSGANVTISWPQGVLLEAPDVDGPWTTNAASSPYTTPASAAKKFYRVIVR